MSTLLILNATIVEENRNIKMDVYIRGGRIEKMGKDLSMMKVSKVLDLKGKFLLPGMIDCHVRFPDGDMPNDCDGSGLDHGRGDIHSETKAAVAGGVTTFFSASSHFLCDSPITSIKVLEEKKALAAEKSLVNYSFYFSATNKNLDEIKHIDPQTCCALKISMGGTRGELLVDDEKSLDPIFKHSPLLVACHCEDTPTIVENEESYRQIHGDNIPIVLHPKIRSEEACYISSSLAVKLAKTHDTQLHLLHVSTVKEINLLQDAPITEKLITADVAAHFLDFTEEDYAIKGNQIKCNPAIKTEIDRAALFQGLIDGRLDNVCSDHVITTPDDKEGNYFESLSGMPNTQYALLSLLEHYHDGILSLQAVVNKTSHAIADIFKIKKRGYIQKGYWADLVVVDLEKGVTAKDKNVLSKSNWTPYDGVTFRSSIYATIVNGDLVYINNKVRAGTNGQLVEFDR